MGSRWITLRRDLFRTFANVPKTFGLFAAIVSLMLAIISSLSYLDPFVFAHVILFRLLSFPKILYRRYHYDNILA